jgi:predicted Zn-dependent protease
MPDTPEANMKDRRLEARRAAKSGDSTLARTLFLALAADYPDDRTIIEETASILAGSGYVDDAVSLLQSRLERFGDRQFLLSQLAQILTNAERWPETSAALRRWLAMVWDVNLALKLAHSLTMSGNLDEAETVLRKAIAADPTIALSHAQLAQVLIKRGRMTDALAAADAALACQAKPSFHCMRGEILLAMGQPILAAMTFQRALDVAADYQPALTGLAEAKARQIKRPRMMAYGQRVLLQNADGRAQYIAASWSGNTEFPR